MADSEQLPAHFDIAIEKGDDYRLDVLVEDDDGNAIDFSSHTDEELVVYADSRQNKELDRYEISDNTLTTTAGGRVQAHFTASDTGEWPPWKVFYEMRSVDGNGDKRTWLEGEIDNKI